MPSCRKLPHCGPQGAGTNSRLLAMSVIEEEPVHMRESRLGEREKHPDDIKPIEESFLEEIDGRTRPSAPARATTESGLPASRSESTTCLQSRSASSSASTAPSTVDERYEHYKAKNSRGATSPPRSSKVDSRPGRGSESRSRPHSSSSSPERGPRYQERSSHKMRPSPEYTPRSQSSYSSSSEEDEAHNQHRRPPRRHASPHSSSRPKASSIPPPKGSTRERAHRRTPSAPLSSLDEVPRTKPSTSLDSIHSSSSQDEYEYHQRAASRQQARPRSSSREKSQSKMLPPFREPYSERGKTRSEAADSARPDQERMQRRMPRQVSPTSSEENQRLKSPSTLASLSETELYEDRRVRAFRDVSPPPRQRATSNPKPMSRTHVGSAQRQVASCRESKMPVTMNPKLMGPSRSSQDQQQASPRPFLSQRDATRTRSTSLLPKKASQPSSTEGSMPRSVSASSLSSLRSTPSPRMSVPQMPLRLRHYEGRFSNRRKQTLFYFSLFPPEKMPMRGVVLSIHGIGDHCRRNVKLYERLCREGFGVITYDLLNHGVSDLDQYKTRAHVGNFQYLVDDTNDFITFAKRSIYRDALRFWRKHHAAPSSRSELPLIIGGTSFGSLVGLHTVLAGEHKFHGAVWGSPTVSVTWSPLLWAEAKLSKPLAAIMPTAKVVPAVQHDLLCRDPKFMRRFKADPLTSMDMMTTRTGHESLQAMTQLQEDKRVADPRSAFCAVPTLFLAGSADGIADQQAAIKFFGTMGNFDKEFKLFDGLFHMVYEEPEKEDVFRYLGKWLHRRFPIETRQ